MTLTELQNEVYAITNRFDLVDKTTSAIRQATLKAHQSDFFWKDLYEVGVDFGTSLFVQNLDYRSLIPLWRAAKYLRKYDAVNLVQGRELDLILPDEVIDGNYHFQKQDVYYAAGAYLQVNSSTQERYYILGCYVNPNVTITNYSSWIALDHPWAIINGACSTIFKGMGKDDEAATYRAEMLSQFADLKTSNILANGY